MLVSYPYAGRLKQNKHFMVIDMIESLVNPTNILLILKKQDEDNVMTMRKVTMLGMHIRGRIGRHNSNVIVDDVARA